MRGQTLQSQSREIVRKVIKFCEEEKRNDDLLIPLNQTTKRAAALAGVSEQMIKRVRRETKNLKNPADVLPTPGKHRFRPRYRNLNFEEFGECAIRNIILEYLIVKKSVPSIRQLLSILREQINFNWKKESLRRILHDMGYRWRKCGKVKVMMEQAEIAMQRYEFLSDIQKFRVAGRNIVHVYETCIDTGVTFQKRWQKNEKPVKKLFVVHACGMSGFIPNALLMREVKGVITYDLFEKWLRLKLIPNLPTNSVVCLEAAPYHVKKMSDIPNKCSTKSVMTEWLRDRNVPFDPSMRKAELFQLVTENTPANLFRGVDQLLTDFGHDVLHVPAHHCDLNVVAWAWQDLKAYIKERASSDEVTLKTLRQLAEDGIKRIVTSDLSKYSDQVMMVEESYWEKDAAVEDVMDQIITNIGSYVEDSDSESGENDALNSEREDSTDTATEDNEELETQPDTVLGTRPSFATWLKTNSLKTTSTPPESISIGSPTLITPDKTRSDLLRPVPSSQVDSGSFVLEPQITIKEEPIEIDTSVHDYFSAPSTSNQSGSVPKLLL